MANPPIPTQIDYTSRDYASLRDDMIARIQQRIPEWQADDPADFGVALVEAFAYMGDLMSYYIDRAANESTLATATRRSNVVALARDLGYEPSGYAASKVTVTFTNEGEDNLVVPAGTVLTANIESGDALLSIPFETDAEVTVEAGLTASVTCTQGESRTGDFGYGEALGVSTGEPSQIFEIPDDNVIKETVKVYVYDGVNYFPWQRVEHLADHSPLSRVYRVRDDGTGTAYVEFGDGISGLVPSLGHVLYAEYRVVDGLDGNVLPGTITEITSVPGLTEAQVSVLTGSLTVTNVASAVGGQDPEELETIRFNAAQAYRTSNRAVTLEDYQNIALNVPACGKASAQSAVPGNVLLAVAPYRNTGTAEERPGYELNVLTWEKTDELIDLQAAVLAQIEANALAGSTTTIIDPVYSYITMTVEIVALPSVRVSDAETIVQQAIVERLDYARVGFGANILVNDIVALVASLGVAESVTVSDLHRNDDPAGVDNLYADEDEILLLLQSDLTLSVTGGAEGV